MSLRKAGKLSSRKEGKKEVKGWDVVLKKGREGGGEDVFKKGREVVCKKGRVGGSKKLG